MISSRNFQELSPLTKVMSMQKINVRRQRSRLQSLNKFCTNLDFLDCNPSLNSQMAMKWCTEEEVPYCFSRSSVKFQGRLGQKIAYLSQIGRFRTVTPALIHQWLWNDAQSLKYHRRGVLLFFMVIRQISRSHGTKYCQFWTKLGVSRLHLQFEFTDVFEMMHKAWRNIEEVPFHFFRSSIKFEGHTGKKIDNFKPIWVRLLGLSQLPNPSDLPCSNHFYFKLHWN